MLAQNLDDVLSFVAESLRKDEVPIWRIADYKNGLHYHEAYLHGMEGLEVNGVDRVGHVYWLKIGRLVKERPPKFPRARGNEITVTDAILANERWVTVPDNPGGQPTLKSSIRLLLPLANAQKLVESGRIERADYGEPNATGCVMTTLSMARFPEISAMYERWLQGSWLPWTERERPRRKSIAFYDELFKIHAAIRGRDAALEVVIGVGQVRGNIAGHEVDHPLVEYRTEIVVDPQTASITISAKDDICDLFGFPAEDGASAGYLMSAARDHWAGLPETCDISPFERLHWEPVLQAAASYLGSSGIYTPLPNPRDLPSVPTGFNVFDSWVLLVRPSSLRPLLIDIAQMREELRKAVELDPLIVLLDDPWKAATLEQEMTDRIADLVQAATGQANVHANSPTDPARVTVSVAPYFPKLSNRDQEKIIRILEKKESKGLVVQGPPGTGKSHSIANILCHALACGWRVLVAAHSDGPLQVLKGMLPKELRNLAINLSSSEQQEVNQLEESVKAIASIATRVDDPIAHVRNIERTEERIIANRIRLVEINESFLAWARENLDYHETYSGRRTAASLAELIVGQSESNCWFDDVIPMIHLVPPLGQTEIGRLRALRAKLGPDLLAYTWHLPEDVVVPGEDEIVCVHAALIENKALARTDAAVAIYHLAGLQDGRVLAVRMRDRIADIIKSLGAFQRCRWLTAWFEDAGRPIEDRRVAVAISEIIGLMTPLIAKEMNFIRNQVMVPKTPPGMKEAVRRASSSDKPYSKLPFLRPSADIMKALDSAQVRGRPPRGSDWNLVLEYLDWIEAISVVAARWNVLAQMFPLEICPAAPPLALVQFKAVVENANIASDLDGRLLKDLEQDTGKLSLTGLGRDQIRTHETELDATIVKLQDWLNALTQRISQIDVAWAAARHAEMIRRIEPYTGPASDELNAIVSRLGFEATSETEIAALWRKALAALAAARVQVSMGTELEHAADRLALSGAVNWANRIRTVPHPATTTELANSDPVIPAEWQNAWAWSAWKGRLEANKSLAKIKVLLAEKAALDAETSKLMNSVVILRTELQLSRLPGPLITRLTLFQNAVQRMGAGTGVRAARLRKEAKRLAAECCDAVPCWIMPIKKVAETQPSKLGIFDLVIIDEASQCGPEAIPVMMRGKKALIVGDDKQVSPTSFMSEESYHQLHARFLAHSPYRSALSPGASMYDLASAMFAGNNVRLREHFRCVEPIIRFSMRFYGEDAGTNLVPLRIPKPSERLDPPIIDIYVPHGQDRGKTNLAEAAVIATQIEQIANDQRYDGSTVGVISLNGTEQAAVIEREIMNRLGPEVFSRFELLVADSAGFQGKERSIMFLSMVDAPNRRTIARVQSIYAQRYNVALSRARDRMYLVHSIKLESLNNPKDMRRQALQHFTDPMPTEVARKQATEDLMLKCDSGFERDVLSRLLRDGFNANPQFPAAGYKIDIVVDGEDDRRLAIELDGDNYHPPEQYGRDMERQHQLERIGFKFWRCWWSDWILAPETCYADLLASLDLLGIKPLFGSRKPRNNYAGSFVADETGQLYIPEEYAAKSQNDPQEPRSGSAHEEAVDAEFTEVEPCPDRTRPPLRLIATNLVALPWPAGVRTPLRPGDMVVVQTTNLNGNGNGECRTRNLEIRAGDQDNFAIGKVGLSSPLGRILCEASADDCFESRIDGQDVSVTVVAVRRAA
ncbi:MAG TPA: AAA domain-containing protein [Rhizomicrobium sp.]|jgi:very-short-patch-repair endonuclease|nr:AAA domain-containing protein [Rhizomicrobium sp.]